MDLKTTAEMLVNLADKKGAAASDVLIASGQSFSGGVRLGDVEKIENSQEKRLGLRLFVGESSAISSTSDFSPDSLSSFVSETVAMAKATAPDKFSGLPEKEDLALEIPDLDLADTTTQLTPQEKLDLAKEAEEAATQHDARITNSEGAEFHNDSNEIVYANSLGFCGSYFTTSFSLSVVPVASQDGHMQRDYWYSAQRKFKDLETPKFIGEEAARRTIRRLGAKRIKTQEAPVVFDPEMAGSLLRHIAAAVSGAALYRKTSFLLDKSGEQIAAKGVSLIDDGRIMSGLGSKPFDSEGLPTRQNTIIEDGILTSYLLDTYSARKLGSTSTGSASRSFADSPTPSTTNFFLEPGTAKKREIIQSVPSGLFVTELSGFGVNPVTGDYSRGATGIWIQDGELTFPVEEITIAGNLLDMLKNIEVVGQDLKRRGAISSPTLKISRMTIASA